MDSNHVMLNVKLTENNHDIQHQKLGVFDILKEALVIIFKNFNFNTSSSSYFWFASLFSASLFTMKELWLKPLIS